MKHSEDKDHKVRSSSGCCSSAILTAFLMGPAAQFQCTSQRAWYMALADVHQLLLATLVQIAPQPMNGGAPFDAGQYSFFDSMGDDGGLEGELDGELDGLEGGLEVQMLVLPL